VSTPFNPQPFTVTAIAVDTEGFFKGTPQTKVLLQIGDGSSPFPFLAGPTGPGITGASINVAGHLILTVGTTPPTTIDAGPAPTGRGITSVSTSGLVTFTDGTTSQITLPPGPVGPPGPSALTPTGVQTAAYTAASGQLVQAEASTASLTVTLPAATAGLRVGVTKVNADTSVNTVTIAAAGTDTISGTTVLRLPGEIRTYTALAGQWVMDGGATTLASTDARYGRSLGSLWVSLGDSTVQGADDQANNAQGMCWPVISAIMSGQRLNYVHNAGKGGDTTTGMIARFATDVTAYSPTIVTIGAGSNDIAQGVANASVQANIATLVGMVRAIGAVPVLQTVNPENHPASPVDLPQRIDAFNVWIKRYAQQQSIHLLDFYPVLVDPATGNFKASAQSPDGVHAGAGGWIAESQYVLANLVPLLPLAGPQLCVTDVDETSSVPGGCFTAGTGTAYTPGWVDGAGTPAGSALSYVTDSQVPGQMLTITSTATTGSRQAQFSQFIGATTLSSSTVAGATSLTLPIRGDFRGLLFVGSGSTFEVVPVLSSSGAGPQTETLTRPMRYAHAAGEPVIATAAPGDTLVYTGRVTSDGGIAVNASVQAGVAGTFGTIGSAMSSITAPITRGVWYQRIMVPTGTTQLNVNFGVGTGTGIASFGQVGLYNATRLGI
jgi:lysophospholipase L1-like esterase